MPDFPKQIKILVTLQNSRVENTRPASPLGSIHELKLEESYKNPVGAIAIFKPISAKYCDCHYEAQIFRKSFGSQEVIAYRIDHEIKSGTPPPEKIPLRVLIRGSQLAYNPQLLENRIEYSGIKSDRLVKKDDGSILDIKLSNFPDEIWKVKIPNVDGIYDVMAIRVK